MTQAGEVEIRLGAPGDLAALERAGKRIFDNPVKREQVLAFLNDPSHVIMLAFIDEQAIGFASGVRYLHPDKEPALFIVELGVSAEHQGKHIGRELVQGLVAHGLAQGCRDAWVLTERDNVAARRCYQAAGGRLDSDEVVLFEFV